MLLLCYPKFSLAFKPTHSWKLSNSSLTKTNVLFDQHMTLEKNVSSFCQSSYAHLRRIDKIRQMLTHQAAEQLIHAFITSRLDFCNSLLCGLSKNTLNRLQLVQNAAARLLTGHKKSTDITSFFWALHCLSIQYMRSFYSYSKHFIAPPQTIYKYSYRFAVSGRA